MGLLNTTLKWLLQHRLPRLDAMMKHPTDVQQQVFRQLIRAGAHTQWGRQHQYRSIRTLADFQERVPVSSYEDLYPYIERVMRGEQNVLWPSPIRWFAKSSGTTNSRSKYIPVTQESLDEMHFKGGKDLMAFYMANNPNTRVFDGKGLSIGGSLHPNPIGSMGQTGDVSAVVMKNLPSWAQYIRTPPIEVAIMDEWEAKLARMAQIAAEENVTSLLGSPTWALVLIDKILDLTSQDNILAIWPNFEVLIHGAVNFQPYRELFRQHVFRASDVRYLEVYNASEGFFGIQDDLTRIGEMLLMLDYGTFYEFIPAAESDNPFPKAVGIGEVELGQNYTLVVSTNGGLWRYQIGDTVRFTSLFPHRIKISGRTRHYINAFGEEVIVENTDAAITKACQATDAILTDYTAGPVFMGNSSSGGHEWLIEFTRPPDSLARFREVLDQTLRDLNSDYDAKRYHDLVLAPPLIRIVPAGTFYNWMKQRGKIGGQHKVPRLANNRQYLDDIWARVATTD